MVQSLEKSCARLKLKCRFCEESAVHHKKWKQMGKRGKYVPLAAKKCHKIVKIDISSSSWFQWTGGKSQDCPVGEVFLVQASDFVWEMILLCAVFWFKDKTSFSHILLTSSIKKSLLSLWLTLIMCGSCINKTIILIFFYIHTKFPKAILHNSLILFIHLSEKVHR